MQINVYSVETRNYCPQKVMFHYNYDYKCHSSLASKIIIKILTAYI